MSLGKVVQIIGAVVDIEFPQDSVPAVYDALKVNDKDRLYKTLTNYLLIEIIYKEMSSLHRLINHINVVTLRDLRGNIENYRDHYIAIKSVESENFDQIVQVSTYNDFMGGCPSSGPSLELSDDLIAIGYRVVENISSFINYTNIDNL